MGLHQSIERKRLIIIMTYDMHGNHGILGGYLEGGAPVAQLQAVLAADFRCLLGGRRLLQGGQHRWMTTKKWSHTGQPITISSAVSIFDAAGGGGGDGQAGGAAGWAAGRRAAPGWAPRAAGVHLRPGGHRGGGAAAAAGRRQPAHQRARLRVGRCVALLSNIWFELHQPTDSTRRGSVCDMRFGCGNFHVKW